MDRAIAIGVQAADELYKNKLLSTKLPGRLNMACSTVYGGYYQGMFTSEASGWNTSTDRDWSWVIRPREAEEIIIRRYGEEALSWKSDREKTLFVEVRKVILEEVFDTGLVVLETWDPEGATAHVRDRLEVCLEREMLGLCYPDLHIEASFRELPNGTWYIDNVTVCIPSAFCHIPLIDP